MNNQQKLTAISILSILGTYLFYEQNHGVNVLLFSLLSVGLGYFVKSKFTSFFQFLVFSSPILINAIVMVLYPQNFTYTLWILSYGIFWVSIQQKLQVLLYPFQALTSIFQSPLEMKTLLPKEPKQSKEVKFPFKVVLVSVGIVTVFTLLYSKANPAFGKLVSFINLNFIEAASIFYTLLLFCLLFGLVLFVGNKEILKMNLKPLWVHKSEIKTKHHTEFKIAQLTVWLLVVLLGVVNITDISVLSTGLLPKGLTYSKYLHQGFYTLIFALLIAIGLVLYFFRKELNFHKELKKLQWAFYAWILQNSLLALITGYKNYIYIAQYGLTYKRIFVFMSLLMALGALWVLYKKVKRPISQWNYNNQLAKLCFVLMLVFSCFPFDYVMTHYNLKHSKTQDFSYLSSLKHPDYELLEVYFEQNQTYMEDWLVRKYEKNRCANVRKSKKGSWQGWSLFYNELSKK